MSILTQVRASDSPLVETITHGITTADDTLIRPAESHWHMVFSRVEGKMLPFVVGPWTSSGEVRVGAGAEILWLKFRLGTFMPHLPTNTITNSETTLPAASSKTFWLHGDSWHFPDFENADIFVARLAREEILVRDSLVGDALKDHPLDAAPRTLRHHFVRATGMTRSLIRQMERAQQAEVLLRQGKTILDTVFDAGYYDQPHLTRSLKRFTGYTPAQIAPPNQGG